MNKAIAFAAAAPYAALLVGISLAASIGLFTLLGRSAVEGRAADLKAGLQAGSPPDK